MKLTPHHVGSLDIQAVVGKLVNIMMKLVFQSLFDFLQKLYAHYSFLRNQICSKKNRLQRKHPASGEKLILKRR